MLNLSFVACCGLCTLVFSSVVKANCVGSDVSYESQPPSILQCNPISNTISLKCEVNFQDGIQDRNVIWYYHSNEQNVVTMLNTNSEYKIFSSSPASTQSITVLEFDVTNDTFGQYWCAVEGYSPSQATLVCPPYINDTAAQCDGDTQLTTTENLCAIRNQEVNMALPSNFVSDCIPMVDVTPSSSSSIELSTSVHYSQYVSVGQYKTATFSSVVNELSSSDAVHVHASSTNEVKQSNSAGGSTAGSPVSSLLIALVVVCVLLGCVALAIVIAIVMLCYLTTGKGYLKNGEGRKASNTDPTIEYSTIPSKEARNDIFDAEASFSNPVYGLNGSVTEIIPPPGNQVPNGNAIPPPTSNQVTTSNAIPIPPPSNQVQTGNALSVPPPSAIRSTASLKSSSLMPAKNPQTDVDFSSSPPIFSEETTPTIGKRSYYTKPDMSKKLRSPQRAPAQPSEALYSSLSKVENNTNVSHIYTEVGGTDNNTSSPGYEDPWENLPSAIKRSRESTRSHTNGPTNGVVPVVSNNNNNKNGILFDDPAYDVPNV